MKKRLLVPFVLVFALAALSGAVAQQARLAVTADATLRTVLASHIGKPVTVKLTSGDELTGVVRAVERVVHLEQLAGKEFYDAVVDLDDVAAVIVRAR
jgi:hypothetical protein